MQHIHQYKETDFDKGCRLQRANKFKEAIDCFRKCNTNSFEIRFRIAQCQSTFENNSSETNSFDEGLRQLEELLLENYKKNDKQTSRVCIALCNIYSFCYKYNKKSEYLTKLKKVIDKHPDQLDGLVLYHSASYYIEMEDFEASKKILYQIQNEKKYADDKILQNKTNNLMLLISLKEKRKLTREEAIKELKKIKNSKLPNLSTLYMIAMEHKDLVNLKETPIISNNTYKEKLREAGLYELLDMCNESLELFKNLIDEYPHLPLSCQARLDYSFLLIKTGDPSEAISILEPMCHSNKVSKQDLVKAYQTLAYSCFQLKEYNQCSNYIKLGLELEPNNSSLLSTRVKLRDNRDGKNSNLYEKIRQDDHERLDRKHPEKKPMRKITVENSSNNNNNSSNSVTVSNTTNEHQNIGLPNVLNQKKKPKNIPDNTPQEIPRYTSEYEIDLGTSVENNEIQNHEESQETQAVSTKQTRSNARSNKKQKSNAQPNSKRQMNSRSEKDLSVSKPKAKSDSQIEEVNLESDIVKTNETNINNTNKFSCNRYMMFAATASITLLGAAMTLSAMSSMGQGK